MTEKLKPCPFCGDQDPDVCQDDEGLWIVECQCCDTDGPVGWIDNSLDTSSEKAIEKWNKRACHCTEPK